METLTKAFDEAKAEGNAIYSQVCKAVGVPLPVFENRMHEAIKKYFHAQKMASDDKEAASIEKNLGIAHKKIAERHYENAYDQNNRGSRYYFERALRHFEAAWTKGKTAHGEEWAEDVKEKIDFCARILCDDEFDESQAGWEEAKRTHEADVRKVVAGLERRGIAQAHVYFHMAQGLFHRAVELQELAGIANHKKAQNLLWDAEYPTHEADVFFAKHDPEITQELKDDCYNHRCISAAAIALEKGRQHFKNATTGSEELDMEEVFFAIDEYRHAIVLARERSIEQEAEACSHIGQVYDKVIFQKQKAREFYHQCITLVLSLAPKTMTHTKWYEECEDRLKIFQQQDLKAEQKAWEEKRAPILAKLKAVLDKLKDAADKGSVKFLDYIYANHVRNKDDKAPEETDTKKRLRKALVYYHPDKQDQAHETDEFGRQASLEWKVLAEEITKHLNYFYGCFKGA